MYWETFIITTNIVLQNFTENQIKLRLVEHFKCKFCEMTQISNILLIALTLYMI